MRRRGRRLAVGALVAAVGLVVVGVEPAGASTRSWSGAGTSDNWSDGANWSGGVAPADGDDVVFPAGTPRAGSVNDRAGGHYHSITFSDARDVVGEPFAIGAGGLHASGGGACINADLGLDADQAWELDRSSMCIGGTVATAGHVLVVRSLDALSGSAVGVTGSIDGGGTVRLEPRTSLVLYSSGSSTAAVDASAGGEVKLFGGAVLAPVRLDPAAGVGGAGSVGSIDSRGGNVTPSSPVSGILDVSGDARLTDGSRFWVQANEDDRLRVGGAVVLRDTELTIFGGNAVPDGADVPLIENLGDDPIDGTFTAVPEGGHFISQQVEYRVTYRGGDGNDAVATVVRHGAQPGVAGTVVEGDEGSTVSAIVTIDPPTSDGISFRVGTRGLEADFRDFEARAETVSAAYTRQVVVRVPLLDDEVRERDEAIAITLTEPNGVGFGPEGRVVIHDATVQRRARTPGYRMVAADGGIFTFGERDFDGAILSTAARAVGIAPTGLRSGYVVARADGSTWSGARGSAVGPSGPAEVRAPVVGVAADPSMDGSWLVGADGVVRTHGVTSFHGDLAGTALNRPVVGVAATPFGDGYWLVASDGGIFSFGDAEFFGSTGAMRLNRPIVGMAATPSGRGYWLVASDGGIFSFGDAEFFGSTGAMRLNQPIVGMAATPTGGGYWLVASDGGIFTFGDAAFLGSTGDLRLNSPIVGMAT